MSEMDDDEYEYTRELHTHEIRNKNLLDCNVKELRIRCSFDERYIKTLERMIAEKDRKISELENHVKEIEIVDLGEFKVHPRLKKIDPKKYEKEKKYTNKRFDKVRREIEDR